MREQETPSLGDLRVSSRRHLSTGRARIVDLLGGFQEVESRGARVWTQDGRSFLNCAGYGVFLLGAGNRTVVDAVTRQVHRHPVSTRILGEPKVVEAARALADICPVGLEKVHFSCSGTEAIETALKLARANGCRRLISMAGGFHGKTLGSLSITANSHFQEPFAPLLDSEVVPFGDADALAAVLSDGERACVVVEPVQGEAGVRVPAPSWLGEVRSLCTRHDAILVVDEVQTGLGRLGAWWGSDLAGIRPDILTVGKSLSGGVIPVSATVATPAVFAPFDRDPFLHTSTFSGAPVAMAAASAAIHALQDENAPARAAVLGGQLLERLASVVDGAPEVAEVRGVGLLIGIEMTTAGDAGELMYRLLERGVLTNYSLNASRVVRLTPPIVIDEADMDWIIGAFAYALGESARTRAASA